MTLLDEPAMEILLIQERDTAVGFIVLWQIDTWFYIEHLAIEPMAQGKGYGTKIISHLKEQNKNLILETALPTNATNTRRISFYERLNFALVPYPYAQPPYRAGERYIPMQLMSSPALSEPETIERVVRIISTLVYDRFNQ
jgi:ribosomal protein S18 acetylase RimI-like enzyme